MNLKEIAGKFFNRPDASQIVIGIHFSGKDLLDAESMPFPPHSAEGGSLHTEFPHMVDIRATEEKGEILVAACEICQTVFTMERSRKVWMPSDLHSTDVCEILPSRKDDMGNTIEGPKNKSLLGDLQTSLKNGDSEKSDPLKSEKTADTNTPSKPPLVSVEHWTERMYDPNSCEDGFYEGHKDLEIGA